ncbi:dTDP-4-dehydrorhamnose reductase [Streptomyces sp. NPDC049577]|uniref:dTDP-4-dehydrorhamnose reductase n=1 Tax=Streptomyces sp. NPDC049577 TaxID=3155153 RepID=UPI00342D4172
MSAPWLVTGGTGMLGRDLTARLRRDGAEVLAPGSGELDVTDRGAVERYVTAHRPAVLVNCAAWTAVDAAETDEEAALALNGHAPAHLAAACRATGTRLLHVSTDYVFPGDARRPYREDDPTGPRNAYGRTKLAGEHAVLTTLPDLGHVVRTAWLYGSGRDNFVRWVVRAERTRDHLDVVADQHGQPTWTGDLAGLLVRLGRAALAGAAPPGVHHGTSAGATTWHGLAREVFRLLGADPDRVRPVPGATLRRPAPRPSYGVLGHDRWATTGVEPIRDWRAALAAALPELLATDLATQLPTEMPTETEKEKT